MRPTGQFRPQPAAATRVGDGAWESDWYAQAKRPKWQKPYCVAMSVTVIASGVELRSRRRGRMHAGATAAFALPPPWLPSSPQSQDDSQPPRHNAQAFDEARNPVTVADTRRRCKASGRVRPCWDQAFPCCSPLTGWAPGPVAASRPSRLAAALSYLTEGGRVLAGSADWP
jgi:hypothetical protein